MNLNDADLESSRQRAADAKQAETRAEEGDDVTLLLSLPGGQKAVHRFKAGVTVAYVKAHIAKEQDLDYAKVKLLLGGRLLIDPLSLSDCPGIAPGKEVEVEVTVG